MRIERFGADIQLLGDGPAGVALGDQLQNLALARRQPVQGVRSGSNLRYVIGNDVLRNARASIRLTTGNGTYREIELDGAGILKQVP